MSNESEGYLAYMLRLWQTSSDNGFVWRASLESPHTGERQGFSNLELLFAFLEEKTGSPWPETIEADRRVNNPPNDDTNL